MLNLKITVHNDQFGLLDLFSVNHSDQPLYYTVVSRYLEVDGTFFYKFKLPEVQKFDCTSGNFDFKKYLECQIMVGESNQNVFLI